MKDRYGNEWTHKGLLYGFVPVYINNPYSDCPEMAARHPLIEPIMDFGDFMFSVAATLTNEPKFFYKVTGELK